MQPSCGDNEKPLLNILMTQISDMVKQLYEYFFLKARGIKKRQKNISSELLESFGEQIARGGRYIHNG